jgi:hypothetical protein
MKVVLVISGYAQAGKDTFADSIEAIDAGRHLPARFKFAEPLRVATGRALNYLGIKVSPWTETKAEKDKLRPVLVALGEYARGEDEAVFANILAQDMMHALNLDADLAIVTDLRYANEYAILAKMCKSMGHRILWAHIVRSGNAPANDAEATSVQRLLDTHTPDGYYRAESGDLASVKRAAQDFYDTFLLTTSRSR